MSSVGAIEVPHQGVISLCAFGQALYLDHKITGEVRQVFPHAQDEAGRPFQLCFDGLAGSAAISTTDGS